MHKDFFDIHDEGQQWFSSIDGVPVADRLVLNNAGLSCDTQRIAVSGYDKQNGNIWVLKNVLEPIDTMIAEPVWDDEGVVVKNLNEPRRIALRRHIDQAVSRFGADNDKQRGFYKLPGDGIELVGDL